MEAQQLFSLVKRDTKIMNLKAKVKAYKAPPPVLPVISVLLIYQLIYQCENLHTITEKVSRKSVSSVDKTDTFGNRLINYSKIVLKYSQI